MGDAILGLMVFVGLCVASAMLTRWLRHTSGHPWLAFRARVGMGHGVVDLARRLGVEVAELRRATPVYRSVSIPKRRGGQRRLLVPDDATKELQRKILHRLLARLRSHPTACGFERGLSIVHNALPHTGQAVVVNLDVVDFFASTTTARVEGYFRRIGWNAAAAALLTRLTTEEGGLPQGAPTSPRLANLVNHGLDSRLALYAARRDAAYTRYADDITISFSRDRPRKVRGTIQATRRALRRHGYRMHGRPKLSIRRRHQRQEVTGLVVNERVRLPRETRRWLRAVKHRADHGGETTISPEQLQGWLALERMIETQSRDPGGSADSAG